MKFALILSLLFSTERLCAGTATAVVNSPVSHEEADSRLIALEAELKLKLEDRTGGRISQDQFDEWATPFATTFEKTAAEVPPNPANAAARARMYASLGHHATASASIDRALEQNPDDPVLHRTKGQLLFDRNDYPGAAQSALRAWEASGRADKNAWALYQMSKGRGVPEKSSSSPTPSFHEAAATRGTISQQEAGVSRTQLPRGFRGGSAPPPPPGTEPAALPYVFNEPVSVTPVPVVLDGPRKIDPAYRGTATDVQIWTATYSDGTKFEIIAPNNPNPKMRFHTVNDAADSARYLPSRSRALVKQIIINPVPNPDDAYWSAVYKTPNFQSYMTAGAAGIIRIYPNPSSVPLPSVNDMRGSLIHETGHTWANRTWGTNRSAGKWALWRAAMIADKNFISTYAQSSIMEDVSETYTAFWSTKGTPRYSVHKSAHPNRFAMLEREVK